MKCKKLSKVLAVVLALACAVSISNPVTANAATNKTDTSKEYSNVGTTVMSTSRTANNIVKVKVKLSVPKGKTLVVTNVKKKANKNKVFVKNKITVHFASSKSTLKTAPVIKTATVKKTSSNTLEFTLKSGALKPLKTVYMSARFKKDTKLSVQDTNFAPVVKVSNAKGYKWVDETAKTEDQAYTSDGVGIPVPDGINTDDEEDNPHSNEWWTVKCNGCGKCWEGEDHEALIKLCLKHQEDSSKAWMEKYGSQIHSIQDHIRLLEEHPCRCGNASYSDYGGWSN